VSSGSHLESFTRFFPGATMSSFVKLVAIGVLLQLRLAAQTVRNLEHTLFVRAAAALDFRLISFGAVRL
jgi:hypothetical protein